MNTYKTLSVTRGGDGIFIGHTGSEGHRRRTLNKAVGEGVFLMWTPGAWSETVFSGGHLFPILVAGMVCECTRWPISGGAVWWNWRVVGSGKRGMVRAGGSASRIIGDQSATDPGRGDGGSKRGWPAWQLPAGRGLGRSWASSMHAFPPLGSHPTEARGQDN